AHGDVSFEIATDDRTTDRFIVEMGEISETVSVRRGNVELRGVPVGPDVSWSVTPISRFGPPTRDGGNQGSVASGTLTVTGLPTVSATAVSAPGSREATVTVKIDPNGASGARVGVSTERWRCRADHDVEGVNEA